MAADEAIAMAANVVVATDKAVVMAANGQKMP